eukprot:SM000136S00155  [mRNA]  locus=s136:33347:36899:+ [translate_table: standard]
MMASSALAAGRVRLFRILKSDAAVQLALFLALATVAALFLTRRDADVAAAAGRGGVVFLSVGDFGVGTASQKRVARQMAAAAAQRGAKFVLSLGDNVYEKCAVLLLIEQSYSAHSEGDMGRHKPVRYSLPYQVRDDLLSEFLASALVFSSLISLRTCVCHIIEYMALGDHDHRGDVQAQLAYSKLSNKWRMPSNYYMRTVSLDDGHHLDIFVTDSVGLEGAYASSPEERRFSADYNLTAVSREEGLAQLKWLENALESSSATWKLVIGHRPIITCALRERFPAELKMAEQIKALLEHHQVDAYIHGHDHVGQHLQAGGVSYIGNGVGGFGNHESKATAETVWVGDNYFGFVLHHVTATRMDFHFVNHMGSVLHKVNLLRVAQSAKVHS